jgi:hypothetical protein
MLDVKTRWNTMGSMIESFLKLRKYIEEALLELNSSSLLDSIDFEELSELSKILLPIKLTVEALSRKDATLHSAQIAVEFMMKKIEESKSAIAINEFKSNMEKRLDERTDRNLINLFRSLKEPGFVPSKQALNLASKLLERLFKNDNDEDDQILESEEELDSNEPVWLTNCLCFCSKRNFRQKNRMIFPKSNKNLLFSRKLGKEQNI